jgi:uncharacterized protein YwqG
VQFYYDLVETPRTTKDDRWRVKVYEHLDKDKMITIETPEELLDKGKYCEISIKTIKSLPDRDDLGEYCKRADVLHDVLCDALKDDLIYERAAVKLHGGSQIGGYPCWFQSSELPKDKDTILLFQIDSDGKAGLMWGDNGVVYAFYNPKTKETWFTLQCYSTLQYDSWPARL